jgi:hypothetical protein
MIDIVAGGGVTSIIMSTEDAEALARELHDRTYLDENTDNIVYQLYNSLVPIGDGDNE